MKEVTVDISKTYALRSETGGEVMDANSKLLETLEANIQKHMTAQESVWLVPDDCKVTKTNFKRAALALGLLGGGESSGLPAGYTRVEWLESTGTQWVETNLYMSKFHDLELRFADLLGIQAWGRETNGFFLSMGNAGNRVRFVYQNAGTAFVFLPYVSGTVNVVTKKGNEFSANGVTVVANLIENETAQEPCRIFTYQGIEPHIASVKWYSQKAWLEGQLVQHLLPALDPTGAPCLFDTVTRTPFYNSGRGDFLYPGKEEQATTYSLRKPRMYAQMTEHGIRRLYQVPKGYNGTPEEYAAEHGFKLLVETPQPEEGYWAPVWHEREDCIELEWVETEPPAEQELLTETE